MPHWKEGSPSLPLPSPPPCCGFFLRLDTDSWTRTSLGPFRNAGLLEPSELRPSYSCVLGPFTQVIYKRALRWCQNPREQTLSPKCCAATVHPSPGLHESMGDILQENVNAPVLFPYLYRLASEHPKPLSPKPFVLSLRHSGLSELYGASTTFCKQNQRRKQNLDFVIPYAVYIHSVHLTHPDEFTVKQRNKIFDSGRLLDGSRLALRQLRKQNILSYFKKLLTRRPQAVWKAASSAQSRAAYLEWEHAGRIADLEEPIRRGDTNADIRGRLLHFLFIRLWQFVLPGDPSAFIPDNNAGVNVKDSTLKIFFL